MSRRLLLLGRSGQLGQTLFHLEVVTGWQVWAPDLQELDISNSSEVEWQINFDMWIVRNEKTFTFMTEYAFNETYKLA